MIPKNNCLECNKVLWDDSPPTKPKCGDYFICAFCGYIMQFGEGLKFLRAKKITPCMKEYSKMVKVMIKFGYRLSRKE